MTRRTAAAPLELWLPPLVLMAVIFYFSAQPDLGTGLGVIDLILRKIVHMLEYALLAFLWWRALSSTRLRAPTVTALAFALAVGYAATDEFHQSFVEGRNGTPVDVLIDTVGASAALVVLHRRSRARA